MHLMSLIRRLEKKMVLLWAAEFSLAICLMYALFYLAGSFGLHFFVLSKRAMVEQTVNGSVLSGSLDVAVWGIAVCVVLVWLGYYLGLNKVRSYSRSFLGIAFIVFLFGSSVGLCLFVLGLVGIWSLVLVSGLLLGFCFLFSTDFFGVGWLVLFWRVLFGGLLLVFFVELVSFALFNVPVALGLNAGALGFHWSGVELVFSNLFDPFLVYVYLFFVLLGVGAFVFRVFPGVWGWLVVRAKVGRIISRLRDLFLFGDVDVDWFLGVRWVVLAVVVSCVVSCLFVLFTVLPWNNPTNMLVSVDAPVYYKWISYMHSVDVNSALSFAFSNDRALFLILCYAVSSFIPTVDVVQFVAAFLIVLLGIVSLFVLRLFSKNRLVWVIGVLLVPFSFQSLGLIFSGYFGNMLALILVFVYILLFFRVLASWSSLGFFAMLGVSVLVLFSHSWTWFIFELSLCLFLIIQWRFASRDRRLWDRFKAQAILIGATVGVGLLIDLVREIVSPISSTASVFATVLSSLSLPNPVYLLSGLERTVNITLGGVFSSGLLVFLSICGFFVLLRAKSEVSSFFVAWISVLSLSILFAADDFVFTRSLFMLPWVVLSGLGLSWVVLFINYRVGGFKGWRLWTIGVVLGFVFFVCLNGSLRYLFNINIW